jgi:hypothetical protein
MRVKQSFWGGQGGQTPGISPPDAAAERIRVMMLDALHTHVERPDWELETRIVAAVEVNDLWQLRSSLMHAISMVRGEGLARQEIHKVDVYFEAARALPRSRSAKPRRESVKAPAGKSASAGFGGLIGGLRKLVGRTAEESAPADSRHTQLVRRQDEAPTMFLPRYHSEIAAPELARRRKELIDAITEHQRWNAKLAARVCGQSDEKYDAELVAKVDQCRLGQWLLGEGGKTYGALLAFADLCKAHAEFHRHAAQIVCLLDAGQDEAAKKELRQGPYLQSSISVQRLIGALYSGTQAPPLQES